MPLGNPINRLRILALGLHQLFTGRKVLARLIELNRSQWLDHLALQELQQEKLREVVSYAAEHVPYYRHLFEKIGFHPTDLQVDPSSLSKVPILTKDIIRENFNAMLTTEPRRRKELTTVTTTGSSGTPLIFMQDYAYRDSVTADIQRHLGWAGWKMGQLHAYVWGADFEAPIQKSLRTRVLDMVWNRFLTNAFLLSEESLAKFFGQVYRRRPPILFGYSSSLYQFARYVRQNQKYKDITLDGIFSSAEVLIPEVRDFVEETFRCRMFNRYGSKELGGIACECEAHTGLHISAENNYVEIIRQGRPARPGEIGDIIVTNLNNLGMPFIRYSIEDAGAWYDGEECPCGRAAPMLKVVQGRIVDSFKTRDGSLGWAGFGGTGYGDLAHPSIKQFQIIQKSLDLMVVRLVKAGDIPRSLLDNLEHQIHQAFGHNVQVEFEFPDEIPVLPSGKHRYAFSELGDDNI